MSVVSKIGSGVVTGLTRVTGLAAIGMSCYNAHVIGKLEADTFSQSREADRVCDAAYNSVYLEKPNTTMSKMKDSIFKFQLENNFFMPINSVRGYLGGFFSNIVNNIVPFSLGVVALVAKGKFIPRTSALGLALYGGYQILKEGFGIGHANRLNPPYKH